MRHDRLKLVVPEDNANAVTDGKTDRLAMPATPDSWNAAAARRGQPMKDRSRMTRRDRCRSRGAGRAQRDGHWLCNPVDPGSSPGAGPMVV